MRRGTVLLISLFLFFFVFSSFGQSVNIWRKLYQSAENLKQKVERTKELPEKADESFKDFILEIILEQSNFPVVKVSQQLRYYDDWVYNIIKTYQKLKLKERTPELKILFSRVQNNVIKGEILHTIGISGDKSMIPWLNDELEKINLRHIDGKYKGLEGFHFGLLKGLEEFADPSSFTTVFYGAIPNYQDNIYVLSGEILKKITNDPAELCDKVITSPVYDPHPRIILEALKYSLASESENAKKASTCKRALHYSFNRLTGMEEILTIQNQIRELAVINLGTLKSGDDETIELLEDRWKFIFDRDTKSRLTTIEALQNIGNEKAAVFLAEMLANFQEKKKEGAKTGFWERDGGKIVIAIIRALGEIKGETGLYELYQIETEKLYGLNLRKEARMAIDKKEGN